MVTFNEENLNGKLPFCAVLRVKTSHITEKFQE